MFRNLAKIFGFENKTDITRESEIIFYARSVLMGTGIYAGGSMSDNLPEWEKKMQNDLALFEQYAKKFKSSTLFILAGEGWVNFSIWYRRKNEDKTTPLQRAISMFNEALEIEPENEEAKIALASVLIERIQVRDLNSAIEILENISNKSGKVQELISKAKRWTGDSRIDPNFDYASIQLIPLGTLREERKKCRALIQLFKKESNNKEMVKVLEHMYHIAVLHDVATHVMLNCEYFINPKIDRAWDRKLNAIAKTITKYSYTNNGKLVESNNCFFSNNDYKAFKIVFGETNELFNPISLLKQ